MLLALVRLHLLSALPHIHPHPSRLSSQAAAGEGRCLGLTPSRPGLLLAMAVLCCGVVVHVAGGGQGDAEPQHPGGVRQGAGREGAQEGNHRAGRPQADRQTTGGWPVTALVVWLTAWATIH